MLLWSTYEPDARVEGVRPPSMARKGLPRAGFRAATFAGGRGFQICSTEVEEMTKRIMLALAAVMFALMLAAPSQAHAGVRIGIAVGPVYPTPVYPAYGYVVVHPRPEPYYYRPYSYYAPSYYAPSYRDHRPYVYRDWRGDRREREWREHRGYDRRGYRR